MRRRCEVRKWKWIQRNKSVQRSFFNASWTNHPLRHALFLHNLKRGEKIQPRCTAICLWSATWCEPSSWLIQMALHRPPPPSLTRPHFRKSVKMVTIRWAFLATLTCFNGNNGSRIWVSEMLYVFALCPRPLAPGATHKNTRQQFRCHSSSKEPETLEALQSPLRHHVLKKVRVLLLRRQATTARWLCTVFQNRTA